MNWMKCSKPDIAQTEDDLKHYSSNVALIANLKSEIEELYEDLTGLKAVDLTKDKIQGGQTSYATQDNIRIHIDEKERRLKRTLSAVMRIDRGMSTLRPEEKVVIQKAYFDRRQYEYVLNLAGIINYQPESVKKIRYVAVRKITYTLYGVAS